MLTHETLQTLGVTLDRLALERDQSGPNTRPVSGGNRRRADIIVRSLAIAYLLVGWKLDRPGTVRHLTKILILARRRPFQVAAELKSTCTEMRRLSLRGQTTSYRHGLGRFGLALPRGHIANPAQLYQLSRLGRALPVAGKKACEKAERALLDLCGPGAENSPSGEFSPVLLEVAQNVCSRYKRKKVKAVGYDVVGHSACLEFSVKQGGRLRDFTSRSVYSNFNRADPPKTSSLYEGIIGGKHEVFAFRFQVPAARARFEKERKRYIARALELPSRLKIVGVPERGNKVRTVTTAPAVLVARAHRVRRVLYKTLKSLPGCVQALDGSPKTVKVSKPSSTKHVISADFTGATDTMYHHWLGILCAMLDIDPRLVFDEMEIDGVKYCRGTPMGLPIGWCLLSITHWAIAASVDPQGSFCVRGDDLIAYWTKAQYERYQQLCLQVGFKLNLKKTFLAKRRGTFCEEPYLLVGGHLVRQPSVPIRWLSQADWGREVAPILETSALVTERVSFGVDRRRLLNVTEFVFHEQLTAARAAGVQVYLPTSFGGLGFPPRHPDKVLPLRVHQKVDAIATGAPVSPPIIRMRTGPASDSFHKKLAAIQYRCTDVVDCPHLDIAIRSVEERTALADSALAEDNERIIPFRRVLRNCAASYRKVRLARGPRDMKQYAYKWSSVSKLAKALKPTPESLWRAVGHRCDDKQLPKTTTLLGLRRRLPR